MLPKQPVSVFFGSTDQDTGKKGVKLGNLVKAENVQQVKAGEFSKRAGFALQAQSYGGATVSPDSIVSPDGVQVMVRDAVSDRVYARSSTTTTNQDQGGAARFVPSVQTILPALGSGQQQIPMAKQAGNYIVWLVDSGHFQIAQVNPSVTAVDGSATLAPETVVQKTPLISVSTLTGAACTAVKSFAVVDWAAFDPDNLWITWVDWSQNIWFAKVSHASLATIVVTLYQVGGSNSQYCMTSIDAGIVGGGNLAIAACGIYYSPSEHYASPGQSGTEATGFRTSAAAGSPSNYGKCMSIHMHLDHSTGLPASVGTQLSSVFGRMTAAACTIASASGFQASNSYWHYVFWGNSTNTFGGHPAGYLSGLVVVRVNASDLTSVVDDTGWSGDEPDAYGRPSDFDPGAYAHWGWFWCGAIAAKETSTGLEIAFTPIPYYWVPQTPTTPGKFRAWNPDYLTTCCLSWAGVHGWGGKWIKKGCCVAQGWLRLRDYTSGTATAGKDYLLTTYEDKESLQTCYHVRDWDTGDIVAQLAYGGAAHVGHVALRDLQVQQYVSDVQHPMTAGANQQSGLPLSILVGLQSQNQNACVDIASVLLQHWDFSVSSKPLWTNPVVFGQLVLAPGPIPTIVSGFQTLREAGPLVFPSRPAGFLGYGAS